MIMEELDKRGKGYNDENISLKDATYNLDIITQISREYGLAINSEKSCMMIFNVREPAERLYKY